MLFSPPNISGKIKKASVRKYANLPKVGQVTQGPDESPAGLPGKR